MTAPALHRPPAHPARAWHRAGWLGAVAALLAGCASSPPADRDGPPSSPPRDLASRPDAVPRVEPLRVGGPNRPYQAFGQRYVPVTDDRAMAEQGLATWYGRKYHGRPTSSGEIYDMYAMTAAHRTMPIPSYARVLNPANGRAIIVRVNDRGPFVAGRVIDLSYAAALKLGVLGNPAPVQVQRLTHDDIRRGSWPAADATTAAEPQGAQGPGPAAPDDRALAGTGRWWLQLGAFRQRDGAQVLQQRLQAGSAGVLPAVRIAQEAALYRVHGGPFDSRDEAESAAARLREAQGIASLVVQR